MPKVAPEKPLSASNVIPDPGRPERRQIETAGWDRFLKTNPIFPAAVYVPLTCWALWRSFWHPSFIGATWLRFGAGLLAWTLFEYVLHRWILHAPVGTWYTFGTATLHTDHHEWPDDITQVIISPVQTLPAAAGIFCALKLFVSGPAAGSVMAGLLTGYLAYETFHFLDHAPLSTSWGWLQGLRKYHARHHFDKPFRRFGVTTPLWDHVLGT